MGSLKQQIDQDLKAAMLSGEKQLVTTLRGLKSAILYVEVAKGQRDNGLADNEIIEVFNKEAKKRQESADLYAQGHDQVRADAELAEKAVIEKYLPAAMGETELIRLIEKAEAQLGQVSRQNMGQIIGWVKSESKGAADGGQVANLIKSRLGDT